MATCQRCRSVFAQRGAPANPAAAAFGVPAGVVDAIRAANKIEAIKIYREANKSSLLDAKNAVEALEK